MNYTKKYPKKATQNVYLFMIIFLLDHMWNLLEAVVASKIILGQVLS